MFLSFLPFFLPFDAFFTYILYAILQGVYGCREDLLLRKAGLVGVFSFLFYLFHVVFSPLLSFVSSYTANHIPQLERYHTDSSSHSYVLFVGKEESPAEMFIFILGFFYSRSQFLFTMQDRMTGDRPGSGYVENE